MYTLRLTRDQDQTNHLNKSTTLVRGHNTQLAMFLKSPWQCYMPKPRQRMSRQRPHKSCLRSKIGLERYISILQGCWSLSRLPQCKSSLHPVQDARALHRETGKQTTKPHPDHLNNSDLCQSLESNQGEPTTGIGITFKLNADSKQSLQVTTPIQPRCHLPIGGAELRKFPRTNVEVCMTATGQTANLSE